MNRTAPPPNRWVGVAALGVVIAVVCTLLGAWQWSRHAVKSATQQRIETNYDAAPVQLRDLLPDRGPFPIEHEWRPVTLSGTYRTEGTVLLRNRPVSGRPGYHVLVPFAVEPGGAPAAAGAARDVLLVVDRGWVPLDYGSPAEVPEPPGGRVELTVHLRPSEPATDRGAPPGQVQAIAVPQVLAAGGLAGAPAYDGYGVLAGEQPAPDDGPVPLPRPTMNLRSSLAYALQWWALALGALVAFGVVAHRERRETQVAAGPTTGTSPTAPTRRRRRRPTVDEEEEDALVDAQLR